MKSLTLLRQTDKFQSCGEIESMHEFEFSGDANSYFIDRNIYLDIY